MCLVSFCCVFLARPLSFLRSFVWFAFFVLPCFVSLCMSVLFWLVACFVVAVWLYLVGCVSLCFFLLCFVLFARLSCFCFYRIVFCAVCLFRLGLLFLSCFVLLRVLRSCCVVVSVLFVVSCLVLVLSRSVFVSYFAWFVYSACFVLHRFPSFRACPMRGFALIASYFVFCLPCFVVFLLGVSFCLFCCVVCFFASFFVCLVLFISWQ